MTAENIAENVKKIKAASDRYGALLCGAVKTRTDDEITAAIKLGGLCAVGENRVQELISHYGAVKAAGAELHFIGHLQKNKVKYIADKVDLIESLDSEPLAAEIEKYAARIGKTIDCLIEVNIGREMQKSGIMPNELESFISSLEQFSHINVRGLMTVAPKCEDEQGYDVYFSEMAELFSRFKKIRPDVREPILSMGMSGNYERALLFGSTEIRVGTGIFGERRT